MIVSSRCVDYAGKYCPCVLAEVGKCPICNVVRGDSFCDCKVSGGVCIKEQLDRNGGKAVPGRATVRTEVVSVRKMEDMAVLEIAVPREMEIELREPGSFVFLRSQESELYNTPISVQYSDKSSGTITLCILERGPKSISLASLQRGDRVYLRGPYRSGMLGQRHLQGKKGGRALVLSKGIGLLPTVPVVRTLVGQGVEVELILDRAGFSDEVLQYNISLMGVTPVEKSILDGSSLSLQACKAIDEALAAGTDYIHIGASDYVIGLVTAYLRRIGRTDVHLSSCNNAHMVCGDGICGACTEIDSRVAVVHRCKESIDVWDIK